MEEKIVGRAIYGILRNDIPKNFGFEFSSTSGWIYFLDPQDLSDGCHDMSIRIMKESQYLQIESKTKLCID